MKECCLIFSRVVLGHSIDLCNPFVFKKSINQRFIINMIKPTYLFKIFLVSYRLRSIVNLTYHDISNNSTHNNFIFNEAAYTHFVLNIPARV